MSMDVDEILSYSTLKIDIAGENQNLKNNKLSRLFGGQKFSVEIKGLSLYRTQNSL